MADPPKRDETPWEYQPGEPLSEARLLALVGMETALLQDSALAAVYATYNNSVRDGHRIGMIASLRIHLAFHSPVHFCSELGRRLRRMGIVALVFAGCAMGFLGGMPVPIFGDVMREVREWYNEGDTPFIPPADA